MSMGDEELMSLLEEQAPVRDEPLPTLGELFADGSAIDLLRNQQLVLRSQSKEEINLRLLHQGQSYVPAPLDGRLEDLLHLPAATAPLESIEGLVAQLSSCLASHVELDEANLLLLAVFILSTWVIECLPYAPVLNLWGQPGAEAALVDLLSCLCRRPLRLLEPSVRQLAELPSGLCPTVIAKQANERELARLLAIAAEPQAQLLRKGVPVNLRCAVVACTRSPLPISALTIALLQPAKYNSLRAQSLHLMDDLQPRLLGYRLSQHLEVTNSHFDCPQFAPETRQLARVLGAAVAGAPALQAKIATALESLDEQCRVERSQSLDAVVLEALLVLCHENKPAAYVLEATKLTNGILLARHDNRELSPKAVGSIMRNRLGLGPQRKGPGYELALSSEVSRRIHRLAAGYGVLSMLTPRADCSSCQPALLPNTTESPGTNA